jgi:hypothetical protein
MISSAGDQDLLLAAWPGQYRQDVFAVDDLAAARLSLGLPRHQRRPDAIAPNVAEFRYSPPELADRLWRRIAAVPDLSPVGHQELARQSTKNAWLTEHVSDLIQREDLDHEARRLILANASAQHAGVLIANETCSTVEARTMVDRYPDDADVLEAALQRRDLSVEIRERLRNLTYDEAARLWQESRSWSGRERPRLTSALVPALLESAPVAPEPNVGFGPERRHDRLLLLRTVLTALAPADRTAILRESLPGSVVQQAILEGDEISDEDLAACLPTITQRMTEVPTDGVPAIARYLVRFPRLLSIAENQVCAAAETLMSDGWDPVVAARAGRWKELKAIADATTSRELFSALSDAVTFDHMDSHSDVARWREPARYALLDTLVNRSTVSISLHRSLLKRLSKAHVEEVVQAASQRSRISRLAREELEIRRHSAPGTQSSPAQDHPALPTDEQLSTEPNPSAALERLLKSRRHHQDRALKHALSSTFMTDELAWTLPVKELEEHPVYGPRLAAKVAELCGDSPSRWQVFAELYSRSTQFLAKNLFKRILETE